MSHATIYRLEPLDRFIIRAVDLNRLHSPDDPLHAAILAADGGGPEAAYARKCLATIHREFPVGAPVHEQAAFLLRAFTGLAIFQEANFRTGWDFTDELLAHHGHSLETSVAAARTLGSDLWHRLSADHPQGLPRARVLDRDDTFEWLASWLHGRIAAAPKPS